MPYSFPFNHIRNLFLFFCEIMRKIRGFKLGKRLVRISGWFSRRIRCSAARYERLISPDSACKKIKPLVKLMNWGRRLTTGAKSICSSKHGSGYTPMGEDPVHEKQGPVPKGHLAIYVGQKDGDFHRVLVPVIYINHPLFGELLREAEMEYGFNQQGGITIPCRYSEFEMVQTRIAAGSGGRKLTWKRNPY
ncbi:auxin-responsive protein SAUR36-like [Euphorbia lathyris]|uniref:auxin-responsive protein SAUR36-like n=1 Tax=Euphorbia lathyris TaxID=212925 RepID=UPI003313C668